MTCQSECSINPQSHINEGLLEEGINDQLKNLGVDTIFLTGDFTESVTKAKDLGYQTYVVRDGMIDYSPDDFAEMSEKGIGILDSTTLLQDRYRCPVNWLECPLTGDCIPNENQCDNYFDCHDGFDEDPNEIISNCCNEFIISGMDTLSGLWYQNYMGSYEKISCSRLVFLRHNLICLSFFKLKFYSPFI